MKITTRMYRDVFGRARLFWKCEDCGLEWRADMVRCPRCESRAAPRKECSMNKFWMVCRKSPFAQSVPRENAPTQMHKTPEEALTEAKRLCLKEGALFVVLEAMALVEPAQPKVSGMARAK